MKLHVFNPEHDIALASNLANFTAPHAGRQLRHDLETLPSLWAQEGDMILTEHMKCFDRVDSVEPWGWDRALCAELKRRGVPSDVLLSEEQLEHIRQLSHRRTAARLLPLLRADGTTGEVAECRNLEEITAFLQCHPRAVLKAPWSSSGRGVRFVSQGECCLVRSEPMPPVIRWALNIQKSQGSVMAEPYYDKVEDLAMEFYADKTGCIVYRGLSLFTTSSGAYMGNLLATEHDKKKLVSRYVPVTLLDTIQQRIESSAFLNNYNGPFGVDMMIVRSVSGEYLLHPCVELNLRRTMGHVALALHKRLNPADCDDFRQLMRIGFNGKNYELKIEQV